MSHESQTQPVEVINPRYTEQAIKEKAYLKELKKQPSTKRFMGYVKLSGPGFMNAAFTLGAGSFASSVTLGALLICIRHLYAGACHPVCHRLGDECH